jgi:chromosomal replication initiation ATPase DnaA
MENEVESQFQVDNHDEVWRATAEVLRAQVSEAVWFSTFNDAVAVSDDKMSLRLQVPNTYVKERILTRYMSLVRDALNEVGASERQLLIDVQTNTATDVLHRLNTSPTSLDAPVQLNESLNDPLNESQNSEASMSFGQTLKSRTGKGTAVGLNPRYTFETFVKGCFQPICFGCCPAGGRNPWSVIQPVVYLWFGWFG